MICYVRRHAGKLTRISTEIMQAIDSEHDLEHNGTREEGERGKGKERDEKENEVRKNQNYRMPESFNAFCRIVSFTAANTKRMFVVSVACVR